MHLKEYQAELLWRKTFHNKFYGSVRSISMNEFEQDGRRQNKVQREAVEAGLLSETDNGGTYITDKLWNDLNPQVPDLNAIWEKTRKEGWNKRCFPFVRLTDLTREQQKSVFMAASCYTWKLCYSLTLNYDRPLQDGDIHGPIENPEQDLGIKVKDLQEVARSVKRTSVVGYYDIILTTKALEDYVAATLKQEKFDRAYQTNLKWGLVALGIASEVDADIVVSKTDIFDNSKAPMPEQWGDALATQISDVRETIAKWNTRLSVLEAIERKIVAFGGWDKFRADLKVKIQEQLGK